MSYEKRGSKIVKLADKTGYLTDEEQTFVCAGIMIGIAEAYGHLRLKSHYDKELLNLTTVITLISDIVWKGDSLSYQNLVKSYDAATRTAGPAFRRDLDGASDTQISY